MKISRDNIDQKVINDFGEEWSEFDQSKLDFYELKKLYDKYFKIFPQKKLNKKAIGFDLGCGSGRWAKLLAPKVKKLNCIDPSALALGIAKKNLKNNKNIIFLSLKESKKKLKKNSQDFGYCLGVLHHTSNVIEGLKFCNKILKKGAPFLIYLYYNFENKNFIYKFIWKLSDILRLFISRLPFRIKKFITDILALLLYFPLARLSLFLSLININTSHFPLSYYKRENFYTMRTDSLDRFGTKLEKRFSRNEIKKILAYSGFKNVRFSNNMPYWVAICKKK